MTSGGVAVTQVDAHRDRVGALHDGQRALGALLVADAHTTEDLSEWGAPPPDKVIDHTNLYWGHHAAPGRTAAAVATADVTFA